MTFMSISDHRDDFAEVHSFGFAPLLPSAASWKGRYSPDMQLALGQIADLFVLKHNLAEQPQLKH